MKHYNFLFAVRYADTYLPLFYDNSSFRCYHMRLTIAGLPKVIKFAFFSNTSINLRSVSFIYLLFTSPLGLGRIIPLHEYLTVIAPFVL